VFFDIDIVIQGGSNMTGSDFCVNKPHMSRSYLNHLVFVKCNWVNTRCQWYSTHLHTNNT